MKPETKAVLKGAYRRSFGRYELFMLIMLAHCVLGMVLAFFGVQQ